MVKAPVQSYSSGAVPKKGDNHHKISLEIVILPATKLFSIRSYLFTQYRSTRRANLSSKNMHNKKGEMIGLLAPIWGQSWRPVSYQLVPAFCDSSTLRLSKQITWARHPDGRQRGRHRGHIRFAGACPEE